MLINRYYILYINLAKVNKQTQFRSKTHKEARLELLQELEGYQDSSLSLIPACIHMRIFFPACCFYFCLWTMVFSSLWQTIASLGPLHLHVQKLTIIAGEKIHILCLVPAGNNGGTTQGDLSPPPPSLGDKALQLMEYVSRSLQLRKVCDLGQKHTAGLQNLPPIKQAWSLLWPELCFTTLPLPKSYVEVLRI